MKAYIAVAMILIVIISGCVSQNTQTQDTSQQPAQQVTGQADNAYKDLATTEDTINAIGDALGQIP